MKKVENNYYWLFGFLLRLDESLDVCKMLSRLNQKLSRSNEKTSCLNDIISCTCQNFRQAEFKITYMPQTTLIDIPRIWHGRWTV